MLLAVSVLKAEEKVLTLEDIYNNRTYAVKGVAIPRWLPGENAYTLLEKNQEIGGRDIVRYTVPDGKRTVVVNAASLIPEGSRSPLSIYDYQWSDDKSKLLVFTNTQRVWRYNTRGDYWVLDLNDGSLRKLGSPEMDASSLMFAKFSRQSDKVAYVYHNNIYVESLEKEGVEQLTFDGCDSIINGTFDWAYEEELHCRDGFRWSSDGSRIIFWNFNTSGTGTFSMINNIDSLYSKVITLPYPKVGTTNSAVRIGVINIGAKTTKWFEIPGDPRNHYLARMEVVPATDEVMIQQLNRLQNMNRVYLANVKTMEIRNIYTDKDDAFLDIHDNVVWLEENSCFTWTSEKDGWRHLYKISRDGKKEILITDGDFDILNINCIDPKGGYVYYIASPDNATERYLFRSRLNGKGRPERISPAEEHGQYSYNMSPDGKWGICTFQNSETPPVHSLISLPDHETVMVLEDNAELRHRYESLNLPPKEFFKVTVDDSVELDGWMIKPKDFDPGKRYPVIFYMYGQPANSTVQNNWNGGDLWSRYLTQDGYILMSIDPRGTKTPKGREWRKSIYRQLGILAVEDHAKAVRKLLGRYPFMDPERIGVWGWSGGGQLTLNLLLKHPDIYSVGIAVAYLSDQRLYNTIYLERYQGLPDDNPEGFFEASPINFVQNLEGRLMIIHGTADDNVHYQSTEMLIDRLVEHKKFFQMMSYPMRSHSINERKNTSYHLYMTMEQFWLNNLEPGVK